MPTLYRGFRLKNMFFFTPMPMEMMQFYEILRAYFFKWVIQLENVVVCLKIFFCSRHPTWSRQFVSPLFMSIPKIQWSLLLFFSLRKKPTFPYHHPCERYIIYLHLVDFYGTCM